MAFIDHPRGDSGTVVVVDRSGNKRTLSKWWDDLVGLAWDADGREVWFAAGTLGDFKSLHEGSDYDRATQAADQPSTGD